jgi:hypothetical protein
MRTSLWTSFISSFALMMGSLLTSSCSGEGAGPGTDIPIPTLSASQDRSLASATCSIAARTRGCLCPRSSVLARRSAMRPWAASLAPPATTSASAPRFTLATPTALPARSSRPATLPRPAAPVPASTRASWPPASLSICSTATTSSCHSSPATTPRRTPSKSSARSPARRPARPTRCRSIVAPALGSTTMTASSTRFLPTTRLPAPTVATRPEWCRPRRSEWASSPIPPAARPSLCSWLRSDRRRSCGSSIRSMRRRLSSTRVGTFPASPTSPEMTGTGAAELYAYFPATDASHRIIRVNKTSGQAELTYPLPPLASSPGAWAFAQWGGRFYVFVTESSVSRVYRYDPAAAAGTQWIRVQDNLTTRIVGAGVSTCAPTTVG